MATAIKPSDRDIPTRPNEDVGEARLPDVQENSLQPIRLDGSHSRLKSLIPFFRKEGPRFPWLGVSFILGVLMPGLASVIYFAFIAAPQFVVETRLVVRAAELGGGGSGSDQPDIAVGGSAAMSYSAAAQPAHIVAHYIRSQAAVEDLLKRVDLREIYTRGDTDPLSRLKKDASIEELTRYWLTMTRAYVDAPSGIITVEVKAFRATDAYAIAQALIAASENLVNEMSHKARQDILQAAEEEVRRADEQLRAALLALQQARNSEGMLDPVKAADETAKLLMQLMAEKVRIDSELYVASRSLSSESPTVRQLTARVQILDRQIETLRASLAGDSTSKANVAASFRKFEELETRRLLAEKLLTISEDGLERARIRADRQILYFMVFVPPTLPSRALLPKRLAYSLIFPLGFLVAWAILALLWKTVEDHRT
jgi:capsular polysaccharide transport system permease protein